MEKKSCLVCSKSKALLECGLCNCTVCKYCAEFVTDDAFSYLAKKPAPLSHNVYCGPCFQSDIAEALKAYNETMERAKNIQVFSKIQSNETRLIKRLEEPLHVKDCLDEKEVTMRLAFLAAAANYNGLVDVDVVQVKVRTGSYQTSTWSGSGIPADITVKNVTRDKSTWHHPN